MSPLMAAARSTSVMQKLSLKPLARFRQTSAARHSMQAFLRPMKPDGPKYQALERGGKDFPAANLQEFIAYVRANQATLQYGSSGAGGTGHLACALLNSAIGVNVTHVPYRGGGPAMQDLIAGRIDYQCALANIAKPQIEAFQAKPIALLSVDRSPTLPDVATAHEQGLIDFEAAAWNGIFLPKETPPAIVEKLHGAIIATLETPAVAERLKQLGENRGRARAPVLHLSAEIRRRRDR